MRANVLYLTYDGLSDPLGQSQVIPYLIGLSKVGYSFTILSFEKKANFVLHNEHIKTTCNHYNIKWIPLAYHKRPPVLSTLYDILKLKFLVDRICRSQSIQIIHCRSHLTSLVGLEAKRKWGVKFLFDMRGFWADERVEGGLWNLKNPIYKLIYSFFKSKEREFLKQADHIISLTHNAKREIESWRVTASPIFVIPTCVDLDLFDPKKIMEEEKTQLQTRLGLKKDEFVLLYLGSWGTWYLTNEMLAYFSKLKEVKHQSKFLIVTNDKVDLENYAHRKDVILTNAFRNSVPLYISLANLALCFVKPTFSKKASSATKIGELMAMGVPIIANSGWGDVDSEFYKAAPSSEFNKFMFSKNYVLIDGKSSDEFDLRHGIERYDSAYKKMLKE